MNRETRLTNSYDRLIYNNDIVNKASMARALFALCGTCTWRFQRRARRTRAAAPRARARAPAWATAAKAPTCARTPAARLPALRRRIPESRAAFRRLQHYLRSPLTVLCRRSYSILYTTRAHTCAICLCTKL